MTGADQWVWAVRAVRRAAQVDRRPGWDAVAALFDGLDDLAVRGVACHLALLTAHELKVPLERIEHLFVQVMWAWSEPQTGPGAAS